MRSRPVRAGTAALLALGAIAVTQAPAQARNAEPKLTYSIRPYSAQSPYEGADIFVNGNYAGMGVWSEDPGGDLDSDGATDPGDALIAYDGAADGYGVEARLSNGRVASTRGHSAPYWSDWETGDLTEGSSYTVRVCVVKSDWESCLSPFTVHA